jgi:hypothetical protein
MKKYDFYDVLGVLIAAIIIGLGLWFHYFGNPSDSTVTTSQAQTNIYPSQTQSNRHKDTTASNTTKIDTTPNPHKAINFIQPSNTLYLNSLIDSSGVTFNENFEPIAVIKLHNNTDKEISQVVFKFAFANSDEQDGSMSIVANECASYSNSTVNLKVGQYKTGHIPIPQPQRKEFETPIITVIKIRFSDGFIVTDNL